MSRRNRGFTLVEALVVSGVLLVLLVVVNALYVGSFKQGRASDEHATAAESAAAALEFILEDMRQMAVRPRPEPLAETFRLSKDRKSIAFLRSIPRTAGMTDGAVSVVTFQVGLSSHDTGNYVLERLEERDGVPPRSRVLPAVVLRDVDYAPMKQDGKDFLRVSLTALSRDDDLRVVDPQYAPKMYSVSSLFEVRRPDSKTQFTDGVAKVNVLGAVTSQPIGAPATSTGAEAPATPPAIVQPHDVPPPPPARTRLASNDPTDSATDTAATTPSGPGTPGGPGTPPSNPPPGGPGTPGQPPGNPWVATGVRPPLRDPIQQLLDRIREDYGADFHGRIRGFVMGRYANNGSSAGHRDGEFTERYEIDFSGNGSLDPGKQIERILERMARVSADAVEQFLRQHGVESDPSEIQRSLGVGSADSDDDRSEGSLRGR
ncbi:MAG: prepilin-type N-terminal cleavage/methylation domain-containing protein [Candidatus Riflebacteria bacterium]|nr:prepilin-type N-terminal cleavage/methylation domain-containing protein [Candidatus Riflebacteria bacterium]